MFARMKQKLGLVSVETTPTYIIVEGVNTFTLFKDIYTIWGSNVIQKHMFSVVRGYELRMRHFFGLDFLYICQKLYEAPQTRTPRRAIGRLIDELKNKTWLGSIDRGVQSITDMSVLDKVVPFPLKSFQREYVTHFGKMVTAYRLKGYMLDAGPGTGKTISGYVLGESLHAEKIFILTPKNAANRVWEDTLKDTLLIKRPYWISTSGELPTLDKHYYICHYESLGVLLDFVKMNANKLKNVFVLLDESHNFNRIDAQRTQMFIELCNLRCVSWCNWSSGTPILALGVECIPFLKCIDPLFDQESEERFRKIYGRDAKRANDILRNRIGHLKYHVPKQEVFDTHPEVRTQSIKIPNGFDYTLETIGTQMRKFIDERRDYYRQNYSIYRRRYDAGIIYFKEHHLKTPQDIAKFKDYQSAFKTVSSGYDPVLMKAEGMFCNSYELKVIYPTLPKPLNNEFKESRSVIKYVDLRIVGEALGILGKARTKCHVDMVDYIDLSKIIDDSKKKTLIFTSFVDVVDKTVSKLREEGYNPAIVYGATNKDLPAIVKKFYDDPDLNPLVATFQSLSTAVPLTAANTVIMLNQPFRSAIREQTIARAARLGQDEQVYVVDCLLDTGEAPNISTRSNDIMAWSADQVQQIMNVTNIDLSTLTLESSVNGGGVEEYLSMINETLSTEAVEAPQSPVEDNLPVYLYHGSAYKQDELMPGFKRSGNLVRWDDVEDNTWLYTSNNKDDAIMLGIGSAIEKKWKIDRYSYDDKIKHLVVETSDTFTVKDIMGLDIYLYVIKADIDDKWQANYNPKNGIKGEYKTQSTVDKRILRADRVDVVNVLRGVDIKIRKI